MTMFCNQCQEAAKGVGCTVKGVCGISDDVARLRNLSVYLTEGISIFAVKARELGIDDSEVNHFVMNTLFETITNVDFAKDDYFRTLKKGMELRNKIKQAYIDAGGKIAESLHDSAVWNAETEAEFEAKALEAGLAIDATDDDDRALRALVLYGTKGLAAYTHHAAVLGYEDPDLYAFMQKAMAGITDHTLSVEALTALVLETGKYSVAAMALLDKANTETYGNPEITQVNIGVRNNPGILISGHDLKDMEELLAQTQGTGVDVYTHSEMLPANYYPAFKKYSNLAGNYGSSWWKQGQEFESFNGPILMTTNCIIPVKDAYKDRIFTTGVVGYPGVKHIPDRKDGKPKDFSEIIALAKTCPPPTEIETGTIVGGFAHHQVRELADNVVEAVKSGAIKRFVVMAGCDGRFKERDYFTKVAETLPPDTVILTAGCAKYRYNKLDLGNIGGIPRVLDAGQCNDSYSLAVTALTLKEVFGLTDINDLPLSFDVAWYEQKAVAVLLALLYLGVKGIHLGPTLPAFVSPNVLNVLVEKFNIKDCLEFFFPDIHNAIDFTKEVVFLDKELKEISPDSSQSDRVADILAKVHLLKNEKIAYIGLILHVEVQGQQETEFMDRMFTYYYRAYDKEKKEKIPVISLAILTDGNPNFRPDTFHFNFCGFEIRMKIPIVKILDYKSKKNLIAKLEKSHNPMVMVVKAQLKSIEIQGSDNKKRFEVTKELIRECGRKGYDRKAIRIMLRFFEWVIRLPQEYNNRLNAVYKEVEEETKMEFLASFERVAMRKGKTEGKKEGIEYKAKETAQNMLKKGFDIETIMEITGLDKNKIKELMSIVQ